MDPASPACHMCSLCSKVMSSKKHLKRHMSICSLFGAQPNIFECICGSHFTRKDNLVKHHKNCSELHRESLQKNIKCSHCTKSFNTKKKLVQHLPKHNIPINPMQKMEFSSESEFLKWKEEEEIKSWSYFSQHRGQKGGTRHFYCQHDGHSKAHRKSSEPARVSSRKSKIGQIKKNFHCISSIVVKKRNSKLQVEYYSTHNHRLSKHDLAHQPRTPSAAHHIKKQIALNVPSKDIHRSLQTIQLERENRTRGFYGDRNMMISEKSIKLQISKVKNVTQFHKDDATSVFHLVTQLKQDNDVSNPICKLHSVLTRGHPVSSDEEYEDIDNSLVDCYYSMESDPIELGENEIESRDSSDAKNL